MLVSAAQVIITATQKPDGSLTAQGVGVGQNGLTPPPRTLDLRQSLMGHGQISTASGHPQ